MMPTQFSTETLLVRYGTGVEQAHLVTKVNFCEIFTKAQHIGYYGVCEIGKWFITAKAGNGQFYGVFKDARDLEIVSSDSLRKAL